MVHLECIHRNLDGLVLLAPTSHKFVVTSRGADEGYHCSVRVNEIDKVPSVRGFCVVGFDPHSLTFKAGNFDTYLDTAEHVYYHLSLRRDLVYRIYFIYMTMIPVLNQ